MRRLLFRAEAAVAAAGLWLLGALPPAAASNFGGAVARSIGPLLPVSRIADANLRMAMPDLDAQARRRIVRGVWENLGRTVAELPHLAGLRETDAGPGWQVENREILQRIAADGGQALFVSGHIGNWEMMPPILHAHGIAMASFYRAAANPLVNEMIERLRHRALGEERQMFPKGAEGARAAFAHLRGGGALGALVDQKLNEGLPVPLFGLPAMTSPAAAAFALRVRCPMIFGHVERLGPARLRLTVGPEIPLPNSGDRNADIAAVTLAINQALEAAIRRRPDGWLWLHRRWPKDRYR